MRKKIPVRLSVELVPATCFYKNVRTNISTADWNIIRKLIYKSANYKCQICFNVNQRIECHELWVYEEMLDESYKKIINRRQRLRSFVGLCTNCHQVKHIGLAKLKGYYTQAYNWLMLINKWDTKTTNLYLKYVQSQWENRSKYNWFLDLSYLNEFLKKTSYHGKINNS